MKIKVILFDFGRVLADFDFMNFARIVEKFSLLSAEEIVKKTVDNKPMSRFQKGQTSPMEFFREMKKELKMSGMKYQQFKFAWNAVLVHPDKKTEKILSRIKPDVKILILSTNDALHWGKENKYKMVKRYFPLSCQRVLSHKVGAEKPELKIYKKALGRYNIPASQTLYIDDNRTYLEAFQKLGGNTIYYSCRLHSFDYLTRELNEFGVLNKN
ncbi:MAG: HAD-IA family hydrolase [Parcubacteria group bacterium]|jgi:HAD superfamily hydrolase (TIGR01509 family)